MRKVVEWYVEDGYCNPGPQYTGFDDEDFEEDMSEEDKMREIEEMVQEDFNQKISWYIKTISDDE